MQYDQSKYNRKHYLKAQAEVLDKCAPKESKALMGTDHAPARYVLKDGGVWFFWPRGKADQKIKDHGLDPLKVLFCVMQTFSPEGFVLFKGESYRVLGEVLIRTDAGHAARAVELALRAWDEVIKDQGPQRVAFKQHLMKLAIEC